MTDEEFDELYAEYKDELVPETMEQGYLPEGIRREWIRSDLMLRLSKMHSEELDALLSSMGDNEMAIRQNGTITLYRVMAYGRKGEDVQLKVRFMGQLAKEEK